MNLLIHIPFEFYRVDLFFPSAFKPSNIHRTKSRCGTRKFLTTPRPWHRFIQAALFTTTDTRRIPHFSLLFHIWNFYRRSLLRVTNETINSEQIKLLETFNFLWTEIRQDPFILENKILFESFFFFLKEFFSFALFVEVIEIRSWFKHYISILFFIANIDKINKI